MTDSTWASGVGGASLPPNRAWLDEHAGTSMELTFADSRGETGVRYVIEFGEVAVHTAHGD